MATRTHCFNSEGKKLLSGGVKAKTGFSTD